MHIHRFESEQFVAANLDETFAFFVDVTHLEAITPPSLHVVVLTPPPITLGEGVVIDYRLSLHGLPVHWVTRVESWAPGRAFVDRQLAGPFAHWVHRHTFEAQGGGTRVTDQVEYALPLDPLSRPVHGLLLRPALERILAYRRGAIAHVLGERREPR